VKNRVRSLPFKCNLQRYIAAHGYDTVLVFLLLGRGVYPILIHF
jgi:hypothetical protein